MNFVEEYLVLCWFQLAKCWNNLQHLSPVEINCHIVDLKIFFVEYKHYTVDYFWEMLKSISRCWKIFLDCWKTIEKSVACALFQKSLLLVKCLKIVESKDKVFKFQLQKAVYRGF